MVCLRGIEQCKTEFTGKLRSPVGDDPLERFRAVLLTISGAYRDLNPENPLYGLYRFKEGFGAQLVEYVGEFDLPLSPLYRLWNPALSIYNKVTRKNNR